LENIAGLAYGTGYALSKVSDPPKEVGVAIDLNQRIVSLAGSPTVEKMKEMQAMIDKLTSQLASERKEGRELLQTKDLIITALQDETKALAVERELEISKYIATAQQLAATADGYKQELQEYQGWFGLRAVGKGLWQFVKSSAWFLGIGGFLFILLRLLSTASPVASAIFGIFENIVSWGINTIKIVFPKALTMAGQISKEVYDKSTGLLYKIVDNIQVIKDVEKRSGKDITLKELLIELDKSLDTDQKETILQIKKNLGY
jgi:hypothetical protein